MIKKTLLPIIFFLLLGVALVTALIQTKRKDEMGNQGVLKVLPTVRPTETTNQKVQNTGLIVVPTPTGVLIPTVKTAIRKFLPAKLSTSSVSYNYKKNDIQIEFCGDKEQVMAEFLQFLDNNQINRTFLKVEDIIFIDNGKCP